MQGDSYALTIEIMNSSKVYVTKTDVTNVEVMIGSLRKTYADGEVAYDSATGKWKVPLTQDETFEFPPSKVKVQARVVLANGDIEGVDLGEIRILESISKEVL